MKKKSNIQLKKREIIALRELPEYLKELAREDFRVDCLLEYSKSLPKEYNQVVNILDVFHTDDAENFNNVIWNLFNVNVRQMGKAKLELDKKLLDKLMSTNNEYKTIVQTMGKFDEEEAMNFVYSAQHLYKNDRKEFKEFVHSIFEGLFDENMEYREGTPFYPIWNVDLDLETA